jgi:hypothetical protein
MTHSTEGVPASQVENLGADIRREVDAAKLARMIQS